MKGIKVIKLFAWEKLNATKISHAREEEVCVYG